MTLFTKHAEKNKILVLGAHADDIEIGCLGTLKKLSEMGASFYFCIFAGSKKRKLEFENSCAALKRYGLVINEFRSMNEEDGVLDESRSKIKNQLKEWYHEHNFSKIFTHSRNDLHQDHRLVAEITLEVFRSSSILAYEIPKYDGNPFIPNLYIELSPEKAKFKVDHLLNHYKSQHTKYWYKKETFHATLTLRGVESGSRYAEAFEVVKWIEKDDQ